MKNKLLIMNVISWNPHDRLTVIKRVAEVLENRTFPEEVGVHQIWWDVNGNRYWELVDTNNYPDPKNVLRGIDKWVRFLNFERAPVLEWQDAAPIFKELKIL